MIKPEKRQGKELWKHLLLPEKNFYFVSAIYAVGISLLSLAIPISVQSLVNTVTFTVLTQPLIIISILLLALLVFSGLLRGLQDLAVEFFQRHFYARMTVEISTKILNSTKSSANSVFKGDLVNRYFEIMTVQKSGAKLIVDGITLILQTITGMFLLGFYHPYFLIFDIILAGLLIVMWKLYGKEAMETSIQESKAKYKVAAWLEQLMYNRHLFEGRKAGIQAIKVTDDKINQYLSKRGKHFNYLFKQIIFSLCIYAIMSALILGLGGFLVMSQQLTLGQLVAAELVVAMILNGFAKSGDYLESFYDLHAALDKLEDFEVLEEEKEMDFLEKPLEGDKIVFKNLLLKKDGHTYEINQTFSKGGCYHLYIDEDATQRIFFQLLHGHLNPSLGDIHIGEIPIEDIPSEDLREHIYVVDAPRVIEGTIIENLTWGVDNVTESQINTVLENTMLDKRIAELSQGIETGIWPQCHYFSWGELVQLEFAKVLLQKPKFVVISTLFGQLRPHLQKRILMELKALGIGIIILGLQEEEYQHCSVLFDEDLSLKKDLPANSDQDEKKDQ